MDIDLMRYSLSTDSLVPPTQMEHFVKIEMHTTLVQINITI